MNKTRKPTTATGMQCPTLFDMWHRIFCMPSRTDTAGHIKAFNYPVMDHWGKVKEITSFKWNYRILFSSLTHVISCPEKLNKLNVLEKSWKLPGILLVSRCTNHQDTMPYSAMIGGKGSFMCYDA